MRLSRRAVIFTATLLLFVTLPLTAAISLSTTTPYLQNFDGIGSSATATLPTDFRADKNTVVRVPGNFSSAVSTTSFAGSANVSSSASNGIYNFGSSTTPTDRCIGFISSGSGTQSGDLYGQFVNNTGASISGLTISYDVEKYRSGSNTAGFRFQLFYSSDGSAWTSAGSDFTTFFAPDANNSGFPTAPASIVSISNVTLPVSIANGATIYLAWNYSVASGSTTSNAQGLGVDNISVLAIAGAPASSNLSGTGSASPQLVLPGNSTQLTVVVTPGSNPASSGVMVSADLSPIGGSTVSFTESTANTFTHLATVGSGVSPGAKSIVATITDGQGRGATATISLTVDQPPPPADHIVISQIYGGGGNSGAVYKNDFVELYNPGTTPFDVSGWTLQYAPATGVTSGSLVHPLAGTIAPGQYYLISLASGGSEGQTLPEANTTGEINISATAGKLALVKTGDILSTACPVGDPRIVDYAGYGSTANCREGSGNAPAPSNSTAIFRKGGGSVDTNQNSNDFTSGSPAPRRTAAIVEVGPRIVAVDPNDAATAAPRDASMTVTFSEPVFVDDPWFSITCASTGSHHDATTSSSGAGKTWVITPNVNFQQGEQCTATIAATAVHDVDTDDSAPNTDTLLGDFIWSFKVATGLPPPYPAEVHLTMGNPSNAMADIRLPDNYLMVKPEYALSYNSTLGRPNWVSWHLTDEWYGTLARVDTFRPDPAVPPQWYRVQATDFTGTGFDRGHMTPNADRDGQTPIVQATFLMSNMVAQAPDNNQGPWANMENALRTIAGAGNELYIISGGAGVGGTGSNGFAATVAGGRVTVPASTWKVVLVLSKLDGNDVARVQASTKTIAVIMPNTQGIRTSNSNDWQGYLTTVRNVEALTGYNFFSNVPLAVQNSIEAGINGDNPPGAADQPVNATEDASRTFTLDVASPNPNPLTYEILSGPSHGTLSGTDSVRTYTPAPDYSGSDSFTYRVVDGTHVSNTALVSIAVAEVNDPPSAADDAKSTDEDTALSFPAGDLTANDSAGPANEASQILTVTSVASTAGTHGTVVLGGGQITYIPEADYNGPASFTYQVCDNGLTAGQPDPRCATATVNVTIAPVNDPPVVTVIVPPSSNEGSTLTASHGVADPDANESFTYSWTVTRSGATYASGNGPTVTFVPADDGEYAVSLLVTDSGGATGSDSRNVTVSNVAPVIFGTSLSSLSVDEGGTVSLSGSFADPGLMDTHILSVNWGDGSAPTSLSLTPGDRSFTATHRYLDDTATGTASDVAVISFSVTDKDGGSGTGSTSLTVNNLPPVFTSVTGPSAAIQAGSSAAIVVRYTDLGSLDTHTASFAWGDGSSSSATCAGGSCTASHTFLSAGVYTVSVTVTDDDTGSASSKFEYVIVFDPSAGFVSGGGWVTALGGKVNFGISVKYQKNQATPSASTEVQGPNMNFHGTTTDWLVVTGSKAQYSGRGTVNGAGSYTFLVSVVDGDVSGGGEQDRFRIRIWDTSSGLTIFDNVPGASDDIEKANPQPLGGGSIVIR